MKVRDTSRGRMYAVSSEIGCTAINGAMAVDIPAGGQSVVLALDKKLIIAGDDNAKFVEVRWGTNAAIDSRPSPSWMGDILDGLVSIVGVDKFDVNYIPAENKLYLQFSLDVTTEQIEEVKSLCARVLPSNVVTEMEWADGLPMTYTRLDFLESTGWQYIDTGFTSATVGEIVLDAQDTRDANNGYAGACTNWDSSDSFYVRHVSHQNSIWFVVGRSVRTIREAHFTRNRISFSKNRAVVNGRELELNADAFVPSSVPFFLFKGGNTYNSYARIFSARIYDTSNQLVCDFIPALDHTGRPCMFDTVTREPFYNNGAGQFIVGMTWEQVRDLRLPTTGGQLTLSLPYEASIDGLAQAALEQARANGWVLTLQYAEAELPAGYSKLDFLESTGTQYIDTGLSVDNESDVECTFRSMTTAETYVQHEAIFGTRATYSEGITLFAPSSRISTAALIMGMPLDVVDNFDPQLIHSVRANKNELIFDSLSKVNSVGISGTYSPMLLFCVDTNPDETSWRSYYSKARIYTFNISRSNSLQLAYIPCLDPEGVPCMFDLVTRQPFRNNGTGQFTVGMTLEQVRSLSLPAGGGELTLSLPYEASIDKLAQTALEQARENGWELTLQYAESDVPAGYRKLDFLESTGTQYIDTGVKLSSESEVNCTWETNDFQGVEIIYGCNSDANTRYDIVIGEVGSQIRYDWGTSMIYSSALCETNTKYTITQKDGKGYLDGVLQTEFEKGNFETLNTCRIFWNGYATLYFIGKIYSFNIARAGVAQADYVPCISPEGKLGMYNKVDGTLHENKGNGAFIAGLATVDDVLNLCFPETNGELTVSVPADTPDSAVDQLRANNPTWQIAIQFRTDNEN